VVDLNVVTDAVARSAGAGVLDVEGVRRGRVGCVLGGLAGLLFNVWPLGFVLDRPALRGTYLSVLETPGRPYADLFVACDVAAGALAALGGLALFHRPLVATGLGMFGVGTMWGAFSPIDASCATSVAACGAGPGQLLEPHAVASVLSAAGLVLAVCSLWQHSRWMRAVILSAASTALFLLISVLTARCVLESQVLFLIACGLLLAAVPAATLARSRSEQ
jgi:hypothetical protein